MISVLIPVVLICIKVKSPLFLYAQNIIQLEEFSLPLMSSRFSNADKTATIIDKFSHSSKDSRICPVFSTGLCCISIAYINDYIKILQELFILANVIKADKGNIKRCTAQCLYNPEIGIILLIINGMMYHMITPGTHFSPAVQNRHSFYAVRCCSLNVVIQHAELLAHLLDILHKIRKFQGKLQISAIADPLDRASKDCSSGSHPVHLCLFYRIAAFMECIREKVRQKSSLCVLYIFDITEQTQGCTISHASDHCIQPDGGKLIHKRLHADPVISQKHHGFFSILMNNIHHFLRKAGYLSSLECLKIFKFL